MHLYFIGPSHVQGESFYKEKIMKLIKGTTTNDISAFKKKVKMLIENLNISSDYEPEYLRENTDMRFEHENTRSGIDKYLPNF